MGLRPVQVQALITDSHTVTLVNVKSDISGHKRIKFLGCKTPLVQFILMAHLK